MTAQNPHPETNRSFRRTEKRTVPSSFRAKIRTILPYLFCSLIISGHIFFFTPEKVERLENFFLDAFFRIRPDLPTSHDILYIEISEDSLQAFGRWPWPREYHAVMTHVLTEWGAKAILFDIIFSEASTPFDDGAFEEALRKAAESPTKIYLPVILEKWGEDYLWIRCLPQFEQYADGLGHMHITPDRDGLIRRIHPTINHEDMSYPHIALKLILDHLKDQGQDADARKLPLDQNGDLMINWAGRWAETFHHVSFVDVIRSFEADQKGRAPIVSPEQIRDKICIIGVTATGLTDIKAAPIESAYPAAGVHGNVMNSIIQQKFVRPVDPWVNAVGLVLVGFFAMFCFFPFRNLTSFVAGISLMIVWGLFSFSVFWLKGIWLFMFQHLFMILVLFIFAAMYSFFFLSRERTEFFELATHDGLTGLYLIRHFRQLLNEATSQAIENKQELSLILMDIDNFKKCNDTYGHQMGDEVLKAVAKVVGACQQALGSEDKDAECVSARYGGEEMVVMIKRSDGTDTALKVGEWIRQQVEKTTVTFEGTTVSVTLSLGVSKLFPGETVPDTMIRRSDEALYQAKKAGKNRVTVWSASNFAE